MQIPNCLIVNEAANTRNQNQSKNVAICMYSKYCHRINRTLFMLHYYLFYSNCYCSCDWAGKLLYYLLGNDCEDSCATC